jgi:hypothetical protein
VANANEAFRATYDAGVKPNSILVRSAFIARSTKIYVAGDRDGSHRVKPPVANLIRSQGVALRLELALLFLRQCKGGAGAKISLPVSALKQDDDALGLINFFARATGHAPTPTTADPRRRCALAKFRTHSTSSPNLACSL